MALLFGERGFSCDTGDLVRIFSHVCNMGKKKKGEEACAGEYALRIYSDDDVTLKMDVTAPFSKKAFSWSKPMKDVRACAQREDGSLDCAVCSVVVDVQRRNPIPTEIISKTRYELGRFDRAEFDIPTLEYK